MTYDRYSDLPQRSGAFQAVVRAGDSVTAYLRMGRGQPVVLLRHAAHDEAIWGMVLSEVGQRHRAIVPEQAPDGADFPAWFALFLDGLGLGAVGVVSDAHFGMCCLDADVTHPDRITTLVILADADSAASLSTSSATMPSDDAMQGAVRSPVYVLRTDGLDPFAVATRAVDQLARGRVVTD